MASEDAIRDFVTLLDVNGLLCERMGASRLLSHRNPEVCKKARDGIVQTWYRVFVDVDDLDFSEAVEGWLRSDKAQWYPQPGTVRAFLPAVLLRDLVADSADAAWTELWKGFGRTGCGPGEYRNRFLHDLDPTDLACRRRNGIQWDWSGEPSEIAAKKHTLKAMGGIDALRARRTVTNEGALMKHWRQVFVAYVGREGIREELAIVRALAADASAARTRRAPPLLDVAPELLVLYAEAEAELSGQQSLLTATR